MDHIEEGTPARSWRRARAARWALRGLLGLALVLIGVAGGGWWGARRASWCPAGWGGPGSRTGAVARGGDAVPELSSRQWADGASATGREDEPVEVSLTPEAVERAGIKTAPVRSE